MERPYMKLVAIATVVLMFLSNSCHSNRLLDLKTPEEYLDVCLDGILHKQTPGPEAELFNKVKSKPLFFCGENI